MAIYPDKKGSKKSFIFFFLIIFLIIGSDFVYSILHKRIFEALSGLIIAGSLFCVPVFIFRKRLKLYAWLLFPIILFVPVEIACRVFYDIKINDSLVIITINSNIQEATELLKGFAIPFLLLFITVFAIYFYFISKLGNQISNKHAFLSSVCSLLLILALPFINGREGKYYKQLKKIYHPYYPTSAIYSMSIVNDKYKIINSSIKQRDSFRFNSIQTPLLPAIFKKQIYILVLGESSRFDHWGINGYFRDNNPKLIKEKNLISITNTTTNAYLTEYAVPLIITGVNPENFDQNYKQKSILSAFEESGFKTYWVSSQIDDGNIQYHMKEADERKLLFQNAINNKNFHRDAELLTMLQSVLNEPGDKKFIVFHVQGSHYDYSVRYPNEFDKFKPSNKTISTLSNDYTNKEIIINSYDNSILYSDYILDSVISMVKSKPALSSVFFIADHGENLFDDDRNLSQHAEPEPSKYIAHIPFFVWYSDALQKNVPNKIAGIILNKNKKTTAQNVFYTYTDICGIKIPGADSLMSLCNPYFKELPRKILGGESKIYNSDSLH